MPEDIIPRIFLLAEAGILSAREKDVLLRRLGCWGDAPQSLEEIAAAYRFQLSSVRHIERAAHAQEFPIYDTTRRRSRTCHTPPSQK